MQSDDPCPYDEDQLLRPRDAARLLGLTKRTLEKFRVNGAGPEFERLTAKAIRYSRQGLRAWRAKRTHRGVAEAQAREGKL